MKSLEVGYHVERLMGTIERLEPPPIPEGEPQPELSNIYKEALEKLPLGQVLFNPPQGMKVGVKERIEARIAKTISKDLTAGLRGRGVPQIEEIRVNTFMRVNLTGDDFYIKALSDENQLVTGDGFTQWEWDVLPLKRGLHDLFLSVAVRIKIPDYGEETKYYPVFERKIKVKFDIVYATKKFIGNNWQYIIAVIIIPIIGWIVKRWLDSKKKGDKQNSAT